MRLPANQQSHGITPKWSHDDRSRQAFQRTVRENVIRKLGTGSRVLFDKKVKPRFEKNSGRPFKNRQELKTEMLAEPYYQAHLSIQRTAQELMWASATYSIERQLIDLNARAKQTGHTLGSLEVDPELQPPRYITSLDIHCQPGGYCLDLGDDDVCAGAIYDKGAYMYGSGQGGPLNDRGAKMVLRYIKREWPELKPNRVLDMGCATGTNTVPYCIAYPDAKVHGIDVAAGLLRYGHARAESLGHAVHFSQQNAEKTKFDDESFDLIVSCILLHETSTKALPNIIAESRRLLRPGGMMVHMDAGGFADMDLFRQLIFDNETYNNNEPFWSTFRELDIEKLAVDAGFDADKVIYHCESFDKAEESSNKPRRALKEASTAVVRGFYLLVGGK